jgi:hypothetical protein
VGTPSRTLEISDDDETFWLAGSRQLGSPLHRRIELGMPLNAPRFELRMCADFQSKR